MGLTRPLTAKARKVIETDPFYKVCVRTDDSAHSGRITIEHSITYRGIRVDDIFALIPLCWHHHLGKGLVKRKNREIAMSRATEEDKKKYPRLLWKKT